MTQASPASDGGSSLGCLSDIAVDYDVPVDPGTADMELREQCIFGESLGMREVALVGGSSRAQD